MRSWILLALVAFLPLTAYYGYGGPCHWECTLQNAWGGNLEVGAAALYWRSTRGAEEIWGVVEEDFESRFELSPRYQWGGRVFLALTDCDYRTYGAAEYGFLYSSQLTTVEQGDDQTLVFPHFDLSSMTLTSANAVAKRQFNYQWLDLVVGRAWRWNSCNALYGFAGARGIYLWERLVIDARGADAQDTFTGFSLEKHRFPSVGPMVGIGGEYGISRGLSLKGRFAALAMIGPRRTLFQTRSDGTDYELSLPSHYIISPGLDLQAAFAYTYTCFCFGIVGEIGYQMHHYFNAIRRPVGFLPNDSFTVQEDAGFAGPYAGLSLYF